MIPIDYVCFVNQTGYAQAALANAFALDDSGKYDVRINCIHNKPQGQAFSREEYSRIRALRRASCSSPARCSAALLWSPRAPVTADVGAGLLDDAK